VDIAKPKVTGEGPVNNQKDYLGNAIAILLENYSYLDGDENVAVKEIVSKEIIIGIELSNETIASELK
jgi:hypothetical protein